MPFGQFTFGWPARAKHGKAGRERNSGRSLNSSTTYQTCGKVGCGTKRRNKSIHFRSSYIIARIPLQSEKRFRRAVFLTASPRGKRLGLRPVIFTDKSRLINLHFVFCSDYKMATFKCFFVATMPWVTASARLFSHINYSNQY